MPQSGHIDLMQSVAKTAGRILAVDYGDVRTGMALSDSARTVASGLCTVQGGMRKTAEAVAQTVRERGAVAVVVGLPVNMDGSHGSRAAHAEKFAQELRHLLGETVPVATLDERMTTMAASRYLNETDTRGAKRKGVIDTLSAQIILQNALDRLRHMAASEN